MFVYKITNTVNDRVYVGLTAGPLRVRWKQHLSAAKTDVDKPLYRAMRKYGGDRFSIHLIYTASSMDDMRQAEIRYIAELKAHVADGGYNLTDHGFAHGRANQLAGELLYNAKLNEEIVAFIRNPVYSHRTNDQMLDMISEKFGFVGARDTVRDARRGDAWKHLNAEHPPIKTGQGKRRSITEVQKQAARETMAKHSEKLHKSRIAATANKRAPNARLPEQTVKAIFYSPLSLVKTAEQYGISKKMVLLIKQRKAHVYLTKEL